MRLRLIVTARLVRERLCAPEGERRDDHTLYQGFVIGDGYEFVAVLEGWTPHRPIRLLPDGGEWPYSFALAADAEWAMIEYCEGDIGVRVYDNARAYREALDRYARGEDK